MAQRSFSPARITRRLRAVPGLAGYVITIVVFFGLGLLATVILISQSKTALPWQSQREIKAEFAQVPAVTTRSSQSVRIAGVEVGQISKAEPTDHGTAILTMTVNAGNPVYENAHALLRAVNPLNEMYVEIDPGGPPARPLPDGGMIPLAQTHRPIQTDEVLNKFDDRARRAITDLFNQSDVALAREPQELPGGLRATDQTLVDLRPAVQALDTRRDKLRQLVTSLGQIAQAVGGNHERAVRLADATETTLGVLARNDAQVRATIQQMPGLNDALRSSLSATQRLTDQLNPTLDDLNAVSGELPQTLDKVTDTTKTLGETVEAARPVVSGARPLVRNLRPLIHNLDYSLDDIRQISHEVPRVTRLATEYLTEIRAFIYNTSSVFGVEDAKSGLIRGHVIAPLFDGGVDPQNGGYSPTPRESGPNGRRQPHPDDGGRPRGGSSVWPAGGGYAPTPDEDGLPPCTPSICFDPGQSPGPARLISSHGGN